MNATMFEIPIMLESEANVHVHWASRARRAKKQKERAYEHCIAHLGVPHTRYGLYRITLTRIKGYRQRDYDGDNLQGAFKAVRDGIAMYLGIDDGSDRLVWEYRQGKGLAPGVRVEIEEFS